MKTELSIIIPVYNEEEWICKSISRLYEETERAGINFEIIAIDDGSSDNGISLLRKLQSDLPHLRIISGPHRGKGYALRHGIHKAQGEVVCMLDADIPVEYSQIHKFFRIVQREKLDIIIASRFVHGGTYHTPYSRKVISIMFRVFRIAILGMSHIRDTQCGVKLARTQSIKSLLSQCFVDGYCFDTELLYLASKMNFRIRELPVQIVTFRSTRIQLLRASIIMIRDLILIRMVHSGRI
jgi:dolichyl-phosphate beta-glucosyltransferase